MYLFGSAVFICTLLLVKVELGLARGKKLYDKRDDAAKRDAKREMDRMIRR